MSGNEVSGKVRGLGVAAAVGLLAVSACLAAPVATASADKPVPIGAANCAVSAVTGATDCFATATEAISFATGGRVTDAPVDVRATVEDPKLADRINEAGGDSGATSVLIGVDYYWQDYGTAIPALYFYGDFSCTTTLSDTDYRYNPLPNFKDSGWVNWNDNIRSFVGYNNCWQRLHDKEDCTGDYVGYTGYSADLGWFRDRAECIFWS